MWVSRFSMPLDPGRKDIAFDFDFSLHRPVKLRIVVHFDRDYLGDGPATLGHGDPLGAEVVENPQALGFEFGGGDPPRFGPHGGRTITYDWSDDQSFPQEARSSTSWARRSE